MSEKDDRMFAVGLGGESHTQQMEIQHILALTSDI